ncbi:hypothetical protein [Streptomyces chiangmaiensis]|uniref:Uncharacterized protein n=1 Tax=Streptomyces chiangmaiensis TaxID=766497 RepID=A0ABU7FCH1_9ACTN|nr:hypothetical protein [Streptomyces chiangmaiensis]MED7821743.1 hypothetical protein [Streptomyces chiangmaiensis]
MERIPVDSAHPAGAGGAATESVYLRVRAAQAGSTAVGDASAWDLFRMAFASVAPPGAHRHSATDGGCARR